MLRLISTAPAMLTPSDASSKPASSTVAERALSADSVSNAAERLLVMSTTRLMAARWLS